MAEFAGGVFRLNDNKAGLSQLEGGLSKEQVGRILTEASEGSAFYENKKQRHKATEDKIRAKKAKLQHATLEELQEALLKVMHLKICWKIEFFIFFCPTARRID